MAIQPLCVAALHLLKLAHIDLREQRNQLLEKEVINKRTQSEMPQTVSPRQNIHLNIITEGIEKISLHINVNTNINISVMGTGLGTYIPAIPKVHKTDMKEQFRV